MKLPKLPAFRLPLLATSCLIILLFVSCFVPFSRPTPITHLSENDKKELADFADAVLVAETENKSQPKIPLMAYFRSFDYDRAYVTIYLDNQLIGCMAGIAASTSRAKLYKDVGSATIRALHDKRFQAKIKAEDLLRLRLIISFLYDQKPLTQGNLKDFQEKIKLGVHSISLASGQKKATYLADVPIKHNWDHRTTLENLCQKAKLPKSCYLQKQTKIKIFQTLVFERN